MAPRRRCWLAAAALAALLATCSMVGAAPPSAQASRRFVPRYVEYIGALEAVYGYDAYKATRFDRRYDTRFFRGIEELLAPQRHVARNIGVRRKDGERYRLVMSQRAAIVIAQREKWVRLVPSLLHYLDYAEGLAHVVAARCTPPCPLVGRPSPDCVYPSMARKAILSFGSDALPSLEAAACKRDLDADLRLAALPLMVEIDETRARQVGTRLEGDASLDPDRLNGVLAGRITAADIAHSFVFPPKPKPQP